MAYATTTVAQMLEKTRRLLGEQQDSTGVYPQSVWTDQFLIDGFNQAMDILQGDGFWFTDTIDTSLTTVSGTQRYALPDAIQEVHSLYVGAITAGMEYTPVSRDAFDNLVGGPAYKIDEDGDEAYIYLYPTPLVTGTTITIRGVKRPTQLSSATTTAVTTLPDMYHMYLVWSAVAYARAREEEYQAVQFAQAKADELYYTLWRNEIAPGGRQILRFRHPAELLR
jgi:hypothetical protein